MHRQDDTTPRPVAMALRLIKEALFTLGAEGDECIQTLVSIEAALLRGAPDITQTAIFRAFHEGLAERELDGAGNEAVRAAHKTGVRAGKLNRKARRDGGLNVGPFDAPKMRLALEQAVRSING